ncbi:1-phosphatidylinositol 4,5-bisphosphate phosphodiesterase classes I and II isoform X2 [Nilaparvata lugens]|uniref:1-phosphatidylinositol 4,5-bisphosphate phosphodiesterase classes I and II isoform X2 n=1 Tax=Nilaparvata lugens TaxID=108931 RepID=UPI00193E9F43|nr:1-phosphatidylinositol 4,5-bisphosphate phosphodiesterase classes I and II isoform X2 [Nilaparvata lugens]
MNLSSGRKLSFYAGRLHYCDGVLDFRVCVVIFTMSGSKSPLAVQLKTVQVPKCMQEGEKFIKWDEDPGAGTPVTLKVDEHGFYLHWIDQNKEIDLLDISTIRDTRTGKQAKIPKDPKLRQVVTMGSQDTLEEKTVTICCGSDFVNLSFINFCCTKKEIAQLWTEHLLKLAYNLAQLNSSAIMFLQKAHTKLTLSLDKTNKIPIKNIVKLFAQNKEDRRRVEKALEQSGFPSTKNDALNPQKFTFEEFFNFYKNLTQRAEVEKIFEELCGSSKRKLMTAPQLVEFLNKTQRDPRLNEILHPYANTTRAKDLISEYEPNKYNAQRGQLSLDGFLRYLMSEDNPIIAASKIDLCDDMDQPLAHYFINSSHNTYLTGHQLTGKSSVEIYRQCLLAGCRCVELDFWNGGRTEEPVIVHGYTFVPDISAREVIEAIAESAFKTSDYPVVLSFENHCNPRQQAKIAQYCRDIFGDMLLDSPLDSHKLEPGVPLPPPSLLKRKIIIKNKKKHHHHHHKKPQQSPDSVESPDSLQAAVVTGNGAPVRQGSKDSNPDEDENDDDEESSSGEEEEEVGEKMTSQDKADKVAAAKETEAGAEISALVNYVQPVHFTSFENSEKRNKFYEMSSFDEKQATALLKERPIEFVNYNKHQLSRIYPAGTRFDSSNFMPQVFWNAGCQLVALNYQTLDLAMQLNLGIFEYNQRCGYLLKPEFMRRKDRRLDPFAESTVDGIIAGTVAVHVLSAQFLTDRRTGTYVEVDMYGLPADTVRKKFRTRIVPNNGINPNYDDEPFVFKKVVLPELACIRLAAYEEGGKLIGHRVLPVTGLCPGYRHVGLRTECGQPLPLATLFLLVVVKDYVPDGLSDFAEALANPIKFQSEQEKRAQQLSVLTDDDLDALDQQQQQQQQQQVDSEKSSGKGAGPGGRSLLQQPGAQAAPTASPGGHRLSIAHAPVTANEEPHPPHLEAVTSAVTSLTSLTGDVIALPVNRSPPWLNPPAQPTPANPTLSDGLVAESFEKIMESKVVKEKRIDLEKRLETLRKRHEKEKTKASESEKSKTKFHIGNRLVKRLSSKNISETTETSESFSECEGDGVVTRLPRSHSERLLNLCREHIERERELKERYHDMIYSAAEKALQASQANQLKELRALLDKETGDVMRRLEAVRRTEVKELSKGHKDKDEVMRMKREVASTIVEKGVHERMRLTQIYEKKREELERQHQQVRYQLDEERSKAKAAISQELDGRYAKVDEESEVELMNNQSAQ